MKFKIYRYVNGHNKSGRPWTTVEAKDRFEALDLAAQKKKVTMVKSEYRAVDGDEPKVSYTAVPDKKTKAGPKRIANHKCGECGKSYRNATGVCPKCWI